MKGPSVRKKITRIQGNKTSFENDALACEVPLTILANHVEVARVWASPHDLESLAVGYLLCSGILKAREELGEINTSEHTSSVDVHITGLNDDEFDRLEAGFKQSGCGGGFGMVRDGSSEMKPLCDNLKIASEELNAAYSVFQKASPLFNETGGVHSAALFSDGKIEIFAEDIARHNAVDRVVGRAVLTDVSLSGKVLFVSGRVSRELIFKLVRLNIPLLASKAAPTDMAIDMAEKFNITLAGFVRGSRMNVYASPSRIKYET